MHEFFLLLPFTLCLIFTMKKMICQQQGADAYIDVTYFSENTFSVRII